MGMYDSVEFVGGDCPVKCAAGHEVRHGLQSKDFDCELRTYRIFNGRLFASDGRWQKEKEIAVAIEGDSLVVTTRYINLPVDFTGDAEVYTDCKQCLPVCYESQWDRDDHIEVDYPWTQYRLRFENGIIVASFPERVETREQVREKRPTALPDDDRIVQKNFALLRKQT